MLQWKLFKKNTKLQSCERRL